MAAEPLYEQMVDAINDLNGRHEGARAVHAKGTVLEGTFTATDAAAGLTSAPHMQGGEVRVTARFSNGSGRPDARDSSQDGRGLAVKFYLPDGTTTDVIGLTLPVFFVRTPEDFLEFTRLRRPDPETGQPDPEKIGPWIEQHPEALPAIQASLGAQPPASYAQLRYHGIHAFRWGDRLVRYRFEPEAGEAFIDPDEAKERPRDYLQEEIVGRLPVRFTMQVQLGEEGDPADDPTAAWPDEREIVDVGTLELNTTETDREEGDDVLVFDPARVCEGISLTGDQIVTARSGAYAESVYRRAGVRR